MYGLSYFLQYSLNGLIFYLASVYINTIGVSREDSLTSLFLVLFAGVSCGNNSNFLDDLSIIKSGAKTIFSIIDQKD